MKISTRTRYGVRLMLSLALNEDTSPRDLGRIAASEEMSEKYLSQIIIPLKTAGLVTTVRGARGGYYLSRPASEITLKDIVEAIEGKISLVDCVSAPDLCGRNTRCVTREVWDGLGNCIGEYLSSWTLEKLASEYREKNDSAADSYSI